ncbi:sensor histidine kinase [Micromonospora sp. SL4-19]|uniref:sensor histidine kinase n=1 Tax=Micromonospora sp. SL4-19 TaxID=3399129 RepID=UPI003A4D9191
MRDEQDRAGWAATIVGAGFVVATIAATVAAAVLDLSLGAGRRGSDGLELGWIPGVAGLALAVPGGLMVRRVPRNAVAWILCVTGLHWAADGTAVSWVAYATAQDPVAPGADVAWWIYQRLGAWLLFSLPLLLVFYPDGRLPAGRWRWAAIGSLATTAVLPLSLLAVPARVGNALSGDDGIPAAVADLQIDPLMLPVPDAVWEVVLRVGYAAVPISMLVPFAIVFRRYRRASGVEQARMRWLVWAGLVDVMVMLSALALPDAATTVSLFVAVAVTGAAIAAGILRPQLVDIERLLGGTFLYGSLAATVVVVDAALLTGLTALLGERRSEEGAALVALLVVMLVYGPLRHRLWLLIQRLVYGQRHDPYQVVAGLAERLERSDSPEEQLLAVAHGVAEAFRSPYVAVEVHRTGGQALLAEHGTAPQLTQTLPITYRGEMVGRLILAADGPRTALSPRDQRLLADVVRQAAAAARSSYLAGELQISRERLVGAREEERRRLRRDLHDGLGPALGGVALRIETARNLLRASGGADDVDGLLKQTREDVAAALADVRRLVHDLRPPALDDLGLVGALRQQADRLRAAGLTVHLEGGDQLEDLPAAVEVAAYRIASEALANVARHARASTCTVRIGTSGDRLRVEVRDDGIGIPDGTPTGVGLISLRERAAELGGVCQVECPHGRGTLVRADLPLISANAVEVARG